MLLLAAALSPYLSTRIKRESGAVTGAKKVIHRLLLRQSVDKKIPYMVVFIF